MVKLKNSLSSLGSAARHIGHAASSLVQGDVDKAITYTGKTINDVWNVTPAGQMVNSVIDMLAGGNTGGDTSVDSVVEEPIEKLETAKEESKKRRKALYATQGGALGEEVEKVGGTFGNARGTLFGN